MNPIFFKNYLNGNYYIVYEYHYIRSAYMGEENENSEILDYNPIIPNAEGHICST